MNQVYTEIRKMARTLVLEYPAPSFYRDFAEELHRSETAFCEDPLGRVLLERVAPLLADDFGHGMAHSKKVAIDAGVLVLVEGGRQRLASDSMERRLRQAHFCGLLHDICRKEADHAALGAIRSAEILGALGVPAHLAGPVCEAIRRHEAFQELEGEVNGSTRMLADCLYDADKFRWGPDNFAHTVWQMLSCAEIPLEDFMRHYPRGIRKVATIRETFRSRTGKLYGPAFIDMGLAIGRRLYSEIARVFAHRIGPLPIPDFGEMGPIPSFSVATSGIK